MRRLLSVAGIISVAVIAVIAIFLVPKRLTPPEEVIEAPIVAPEEELNVPIAAPVSEDFVPESPPEEADPGDPNATETTVSTPLPYFPPPSYDLTGGRLGRQRVPGTEDIGDVGQLYFHLPSYTLYMTVNEFDGLRSVWRLDQHGRVERVFAANRQPGEIRLFGTSDGTIYVQHNNPSRMYRTDDLFVSWRTVLEDFGMFWAMADNGLGTVYGTQHDFNSAILFRSTDKGMTWEPWKDFQKIFPEEAVRYSDEDPRFRLRHLHDVIYSRGADALIVGVGDVARFAVESRDNGETWRKIWDEGFTSHTIVSGGARYLLGPDKLRGPGIALYDAHARTIVQVWDPGEHGYAGYVYSMINVDGIYYAAVHTEANEVEEIVPKFGIVVSPDAHTWYPFLEYGPLTNHARTDIWLAPAPATVYTSINGALYAFRPLPRDWFEFNIQRPFR